MFLSIHYSIFLLTTIKLHNHVLIYISDIFQKIYGRSSEFDQEGIAKIWIGPRLLVFLYDPRDVELILSSHVHIDKAEEYRLFKPWLGNGLLISTGNNFAYA